MVCKRVDWPVFLMLAIGVLLLPMKWLIAVLMAGAVHELGHYIALRLCGVQVLGFKIGLDGAQMRVGPMSRWQELVCAVSGPLAGLSMLFFAQWFPRTAVCALIHSGYNFLPVYPLDGGRVLRCVFINEKVYRCIEVICLILIALAGIYGSLVLSLGVLPLAASILTIQRALAGKGLANRLSFRYNRKRNDERGICDDRPFTQNSPNGAETGPVYRR